MLAGIFHCDRYVYAQSQTLRDWLSVPKSNGYQSSHTTVMGPEGKWVEVQISHRTHGRDSGTWSGSPLTYKGVKGESGLDEWLTSIRETLETPRVHLEVMDQFQTGIIRRRSIRIHPQR